MSHAPSQSRIRSSTIRPSSVAGSADISQMAALRARPMAVSIWSSVMSSSVEAVLAALQQPVRGPLRPEARVPVVGEVVRVRGVHDRIVGRHDRSRLGVEQRGQLVERDAARPFVRAVVPGAWPQAGRVAVADRERAGQLVADVAVDVGIDEVLARRAVQRQALPELLERVRGVESEDRLERAIGLRDGRPVQAHERRVGEALLDVVEDRSVGRRGGPPGGPARMRPSPGSPRSWSRTGGIRHRTGSEWGRPGRPARGTGPGRPFRRSWRPTRCARCDRARPPGRPGTRRPPRRTGRHR